MNREDWRDRLIDGLLREIVGGEMPPELSGRVLAEAFPAARPRRVRRAAWAAGIAAAIVAAVCIFALWPRYPAPRAQGNYEVTEGGRVKRGAVLTTKVGEAELNLGGYATVRMTPQTALQIEGDRFAEAVYLRRGEVLCNVAQERGTFEVRSDIGVVSVSGTQFSVSILEEEGGTDMSAKRMMVKVMAGAVLVAGTWGQRALYAGDEATVPDAGPLAAVAARDAAEEGLPDGLKGFSGQVRGVVTAKGDRNTFDFKVGRLLRTWKNNKAENPELIVGRTVLVAPRWAKGEDGKWRPVELHVAFIRTLVVGQELTLEIRNPELDHFAILELSEEQRVMARRSAETGASPERDREGVRPKEGGDRTRSSPEREQNLRIRNLEKEIERLRRENAELLRLLESRR